MKRKIGILIVSLVFILMSFSGCLSFESSSDIIVDIESTYSYNANGEIYVDGNEYCDAYSQPNDFISYTINKYELNEQNDDYTITLSLMSGGVIEEATADNVKEYVRFNVYGVTRETDYGMVEDHKIQVVEIS